MNEKYVKIGQWSFKTFERMIDDINTHSLKTERIQEMLKVNGYIEECDPNFIRIEAHLIEDEPGNLRNIMMVYEVPAKQYTKIVTRDITFNQCRDIEKLLTLGLCISSELYNIPGKSRNLKLVRVEFIDLFNKDSNSNRLYTVKITLEELK